MSAGGSSATVDGGDEVVVVATDGVSVVAGEIVVDRASVSGWVVHPATIRTAERRHHGDRIGEKATHFRS
jgi:hypothetical protein